VGGCGQDCGHHRLSLKEFDVPTLILHGDDDQIKA
jgi:pimeloyl-ACP methyl ester carboxylesterase